MLDLDSPNEPIEVLLPKPFLRWAGSKRRISSIILENAPKRYGCFFEPFLGSGAIFFKMLPNQACIGDLNPEVATTFSAIKSNPLLVAEYLYGIPLTKDAFLTLRSLNIEDLTEAQRAARLIFLMKGCFNGVYRCNRAGIFNVPFGNKFYKLPTLCELIAASQALQNTKIVNGDYRTLVVDAVENDFVYLDPPYGSAKRYRGEYGYASSFLDNNVLDLIEVCNSLTTRGVRVMLSYNWCNELVEALHNWRIQKLYVNRSVSSKIGTRTRVCELIAMNY